MAITCTRCEGTGFLNIEQVPSAVVDNGIEAVEAWLKINKDNDVCICDCCGDGDSYWYGTPGEHYNYEDMPGRDGPYGYNGGLCECH